MSRIRDILSPLLGYTLLTGLYTYPWSVNLLNALPAGGDTLVFVWWFSHLRGALLGEHGFFYSSYILHPIEGVFLPSHISFPIAIIALGVPLSFLLGDVVAFNVCVYLSFVLTGYGTHLLVRYLTGKGWPSFLAGCIPAFAPFHYVSFIQGQLEAMSIQWFPFTILFCFKLKDHPSVKNAVGLGVFTALVVLTSPYYVFVLLVFFVLFFLWYRRVIFSAPVFRQAAFALVTGAALALPFYGPIIWNRLGNGIGGHHINEFDFYSADLLSFFLPASFHPIFGALTNRAYHDLVIGTVQSYVGISVLLVALWAVLRHRLSTTWFFALVLIVFFVLSLGSSLHVGRLRVNFTWDRGFWGVPPDTPIKFRGARHPILLPFYYLHQYVPLFSMLRYPTRFQIPFILALSVLYGTGLAALTRAITRARIVAVGIAALVLLSFEYLHPPVAMYHPSVSSFYRAIGHDSSDFAILEVPIAPHSEYLYYQTVHGKRIMIGYMSVPVPEFIRFVQQTPFLYAVSNAHLPGKWDWGEPLDRTPLDEAEMARTIEKLKAWNVKYLVYHRELDPVRDESIPKFFDELARSGRASYQDASIVAITPDALRLYPDFRRRGVIAGSLRPEAGLRSERADTG